MMVSRLSVAVFLLMLTAVLAAAKDLRATIVYDDVATESSPVRVEGGQLWITTADLKRATRFELKPQGACRDVLCFPIPKGRTAEFQSRGGGHEWFNLKSWNYKRQAWALSDAKRDYGTTFKEEVEKIGGSKVYYPAPELPAEPKKQN
jgi:hypothetical protein